MKKLKGLCIVMLFAVLVAVGGVDAPTVKAGGGTILFDIGLNETIDFTQYYGSDCNLSSSNSMIAMVSDDGLVTGISYGKAVVTVTWKGDVEGEEKRKAIVTVTKPQQCIERPLFFQPGFYEYAYQKHKPQNVAIALGIFCLNPKAEYVYSTTSDLIKIEPDGTIQEVKGTGVAEIILTENYNNKEEQVGKYKLKIKKIKVRKYGESEREIGETWGDYFNVGMAETWGPYYELVTLAEGKCIFVLSDEKIRNQEEFDQKVNPVMPRAGKNQSKNVLKYVYDKRGKWEGRFVANKPGTTYVVEAYYNYITGKYVFVHCEKVTVTEK